MLFLLFGVFAHESLLARRASEHVVRTERNAQRHVGHIHPYSQPKPKHPEPHARQSLVQGLVEAVKSSPAVLEGELGPGADPPDGAPVDTEPHHSPADVANEWSPYSFWGIVALGTVAAFAVVVGLWFAWTERDSAARTVAATLPLTGMDLLLHREFQVVKTEGIVELDLRDGKDHTKAKEASTTAPFSGQSCVYAATDVEVWTGTGWDLVAELVEARTFVLAQKGNPGVVVEVSSQATAALDLLPSSNFQGDFVQLPPAVQKKLQAMPGKKFPAYSMFKVREWTVQEGQTLQAVGLVVRRVGKKETRIALAPGGLGASNADATGTLFSPVRVSRWHSVGNRVVLSATEAQE